MTEPFQCAICQDPAAEVCQNNVVILPCTHRFHLNCLWNVEAVGNKLCPLCRSAFPSLNPAATATSKIEMRCDTVGLVQNDDNVIANFTGQKQDENSTPIGPIELFVDMHDSVLRALFSQLVEFREYPYACSSCSLRVRVPTRLWNGCSQCGRVYCCTVCREQSELECCELVEEYRIMLA